jgi:hypothetical protein
MRSCIVLVATAIALLLASAASADRTIVVNGQMLDAEQMAILDAIACTHVPPGRYWLLPNGAWGYEGVPVIAGFLGQGCAVAAEPQPRESLSERGLLYSPGELLR